MAEHHRISEKIITGSDHGSDHVSSHRRRRPKKKMKRKAKKIKITVVK